MVFGILNINKYSMWIESKYIWQNGGYILWDESVEHTVSHALHYGTSAFEGIRFYNTSKWQKVFRLKDHIERLFYSASVVDIEMRYTIDDIVTVCKDIIKKNELKNWYLRPIIYYWYGKMWLNPIGCNINTIVSCWPWWKYLSDNPIKVAISTFRRLHPLSAVMEAKVGGYYINSVLAHRQVTKKWYEEALLLDFEWNIAEWPWENIFFIKWNKLYTPKLGTILPGITRDSIMKLVKKELWLDVIEEKITPDQLKDYDEAFFVWTAAEVSPIWSICDLSWNEITYDTKISNTIRDLYLDVVGGKMKGYMDWLV